MKSTRVNTIGERRPHYRESRPNDYLYDPVYCVSGTKNHHDQADMKATQETAECAICPVYNSIFGDLKTEQRDEVVISFGRLVPAQKKPTTVKTTAMPTPFEGVKGVSVDGADRHQFFRRPLVPFMNPTIPPLLYSRDKPRSHTKTLRLKSPDQTSRPGTLPTATTATQTDYRESEAQTDPWDTPYTIIGNTTPEIISLAHLSWKKGLPAGMHEIEIIERARIKRTWESTLPPVTDTGAADKRRKIVEAIERDEWAFREAEIQHINELRLELTKRLLGEKMGEMAVIHEERIAKYKARRYKEKEKKVAVIRHETSRALRKLHLKHEGVTGKYRKGDVVEEHDDRRSEWYGPQMRFGEHPMRAHLDIRCDPRFFTQAKGLEMLERVPKMLPGYEAIRFAAPPGRESYELCIRETRWTEEKLRKLHEDLKEIRMKRQQGPSPLRLLKRVPKAVVRCTTPTIEGVPDWEEEVFEAAVLLQKIIRGRAIQTMMYKGMNKCSELIEELRSTHALHEAGMEKRAEERFEVMSQQRAHQLINMKKGALEETLSSLEGESIARSLDYFSKELWRLQDERRVHAFALLAERERHRREALEAGRRQVEERRRKEHDEMFKQVVKVHQDTVDIYLEDLIIDSMSWVAEAEAREYVRELAKRVDEAAQEAHTRKDCIEQDEIIADLVHNFVMPEVQKQMVREKMKQRQGRYLSAAHDTIYGTLQEQLSRPQNPYGSKRQSSVTPTNTSGPESTPEVLYNANATRDDDSNSVAGDSALLFASYRTAALHESPALPIVEAPEQDLEPVETTRSNTTIHTFLQLERKPSREMATIEIKHEAELQPCVVEQDRDDTDAVEEELGPGREPRVEEGEVQEETDEARTLVMEKPLIEDVVQEEDPTAREDDTGNAGKGDLGPDTLRITKEPLGMKVEPPLEKQASVVSDVPSTIEEPSGIEEDLMDVESIDAENYDNGDAHEMEEHSPEVHEDPHEEGFIVEIDPDTMTPHRRVFERGPGDEDHVSEGHDTILEKPSQDDFFEETEDHH